MSLNNANEIVRDDNNQAMDIETGSLDQQAEEDVRGITKETAELVNIRDECEDSNPFRERKRQAI